MSRLFNLGMDKYGRYARLPFPSCDFFSCHNGIHANETAVSRLNDRNRGKLRDGGGGKRNVTFHGK